MERHLTRRAIKVAEAARSLDINNVAVETSYRPQKDGQTNLSEIAIIFFDPITIKLRKKGPVASYTDLGPILLRQKREN